MSQGDTIKIQGVAFKILKREGDRLTLTWTENTGIVKIRTIIYKLGGLK